MDYIDLIKNIDNNKIKNINLIHIEEPYFLELGVDVLKKDFLGEDFLDFNYEKVDFDTLTTDSFDNMVETLPLMSEKRLVIIDETDISRDSLKKNEEMLSYISDKFKDFNDLTYIFFIYNGEKLFKGKFVKQVEKFGQVYTFGRLDRNKFASFVGKYFASNGVRLDNKSTKLIVDRLRYLDRDATKNLIEVENELSKLLNNIKSNQPSYDEIEESIIDTFEEKIFGLLDYMSTKDALKAIKAYKTMEGEDKFMIYYMIIRQIRNMICVKSCKDNKVIMQTGQSYCGLGNFEYGKLERFVDKFTMDDLLKIHSLCFESEQMIKTSRREMDDLIERIIFEFCRR